MATEQAASDESVSKILANLSDEQCRSLFLALKQKYDKEEEGESEPAPEVEPKPEDQQYGMDMVP